MTRFFAACFLLMFACTAFAAEQTPSQVYMEYHAALKRSYSEEGVWPYYTDRAREEFNQKFPPQYRGTAISMMKTATPNAVQVVKEEVDGDSARLILHTSEDRLLRGVVELRREYHQWRIDNVVWQQE